MAENELIIERNRLVNKISKVTKETPKLDSDSNNYQEILVNIKDHSLAVLVEAYLIENDFNWYDGDRSGVYYKSSSHLMEVRLLSDIHGWGPSQALLQDVYKTTWTPSGTARIPSQTLIPD